VYAQCSAAKEVEGGGKLISRSECGTAVAVPAVPVPTALGNIRDSHIYYIPTYTPETECCPTLGKTPTSHVRNMLLSTPLSNAPEDTNSSAHSVKYWKPSSSHCMVVPLESKTRTFLPNIGYAQRYCLMPISDLLQPTLQLPPDQLEGW
jgi:hypothetical protein